MPVMSSERNNSIQQIFQMFSGSGFGEVNWNKEQMKAAAAIINCRTPILGGHACECENCGHIEISYNSCRNRHCPLCGGLAKEKWIARRVQDIVDTMHYHIVFTIPCELYRIAMANQKVFYELMFEASSQCIKKFCSDNKYLGAVPGMTAVLHTWGQQLVFHPHIHMVVSAGGYAPDGSWKNKVKKNIFLPVKAVSRYFRGLLVSLIRNAYKSGRIIFDSNQLSGMLDVSMAKKWVVYCRKPFKNNAGVYEYLGRYTHRTAISNDRIVSFDEKTVAFSYRDYSDKNKIKNRTVSVSEFVRLFMLHILPSGFMRIRHYGIYASACRNTKLRDCKIMTLTRPPETKIDPNADTPVIIFQLTGRDIRKCPLCGGMYHIRTIP